jgi:hypothetical protein
MSLPAFKHPPTPPAIIAFVPKFVPDATVEAAQREFDGSAGEPTWALKPHETVCSVCWIVKPCDCETR